MNMEGDVTDRTTHRRQEILQTRTHQWRAQREYAVDLKRTIPPLETNTDFENPNNQITDLISKLDTNKHVVEAVYKLTSLFETEDETYIEIFIAKNGLEKILKLFNGKSSVQYAAACCLINITSYVTFNERIAPMIIPYCIPILIESNIPNIQDSSFWILGNLASTSKNICNLLVRLNILRPLSQFYSGSMSEFVQKTAFYCTLNLFIHGDLSIGKEAQMALAKLVAEKFLKDSESTEDFETFYWVLSSFSYFESIEAFATKECFDKILNRFFVEIDKIDNGSDNYYCLVGIVRILANLLANDNTGTAFMNHLTSFKNDIKFDVFGNIMKMKKMAGPAISDIAWFFDNLETRFLLEKTARQT